MTPHYGYGTCVTPGCPYTVPKRKITLQWKEGPERKKKKWKEWQHLVIIHHHHYNIKLCTLMTYKDYFNVKKTSSWVIQMSMKSVE